VYLEVLQRGRTSALGRVDFSFDAPDPVNPFHPVEKPPAQTIVSIHPLQSGLEFGSLMKRIDAGMAAFCGRRSSISKSTMIHPDLLKILVCPEDHSPLTAADDALVQRLNEAIVAGRLKNRGGQVLQHRLDGALLRGDAALAYPIVDDIPMMLMDEAVPLDQLNQFGRQ
jgi:uncharacterized protein YbaR (Trm112 family)